MEYLREVRKRLKQRGTTSEHQMEDLQELFDRHQQITKEMHVAQVAALEEAKKPFLEKLSRIEDEMGLFLQLRTS